MPKETKVEAPKSYHGHRARQRRRILSASRELFDERGIDRTTMVEIIAASGVRASTLYEYFSNKDDIVWAVLGHLMEEHFQSAKKVLETPQTGLAKIRALLELLADELSEDDGKIRFMAQFDAMYARDWPVERLLTLEGQHSNGGFEAFGVLIREGIADGSLRNDLDPELTLHAVINGVVGAQRRLASLGTKVETEYGRSINQLFREMIRIVILGLSAPERSGPPTAQRAAHKVKTGRKTP